MQTNAEYINEFKDYIDFMDIVESVDKETEETMTRLNLFKKEEGVRLFFESSTREEYLLFCEEEEQKASSSIGEGLKKMIDKFIEFIKKIGEKIKSLFDTSKHDQKVVEQMIAKNPSLGKEIVVGLRNEWFTYGDIAKYNKDMFGLMNMLMDKKFEHEELEKKLSAIEYEYQRSENSLLDIGNKIVSISAIIGSLVAMYGYIKSGAEGVKKFSGWLEAHGAAPGDAESKGYAFAQKVASRFTKMNATVGNKLNKASSSINKRLHIFATKGNK